MKKSSKIQVCSIRKPKSPLKLKLIRRQHRPNPNCKWLSPLKNQTPQTYLYCYRLLPENRIFLLLSATCQHCPPPSTILPCPVPSFLNTDTHWECAPVFTGAKPTPNCGGSTPPPWCPLISAALLKGVCLLDTFAASPVAIRPSPAR